jgi:hypothetical protein
MFENILERFSAHLRMLYSTSYSILFPKHFNKPYRPIDNSLTPLWPATAVPTLTSAFLNEFSPKDSPTSTVIGYLFLIKIFTSPSVTI